MGTAIRFRVHRGVVGDKGIQRVLLIAAGVDNDTWLGNPHVLHAEFEVDASTTEAQTFQQGNVVLATFTEEQ